jgi:hypothetical protein
MLMAKARTPVVESTVAPGVSGLGRFVDDEANVNRSWWRKDERQVQGRWTNARLL